jgi:hypothetical protein
MTVILVLLTAQQAWCTDQAVHDMASTISGAVLPFVAAGELCLIPNGKMGSWPGFWGV